MVAVTMSTTTTTAGGKGLQPVKGRDLHVSQWGIKGKGMQERNVNGE